MKAKVTAALFALLFIPDLALAMGGCSDAKKDVTASSCKDGTIYDSATGACVPNPAT